MPSGLIARLFYLSVLSEVDRFQSSCYVIVVGCTDGGVKPRQLTCSFFALACDPIFQSENYCDNPTSLDLKLHFCALSSPHSVFTVYNAAVKGPVCKM